MVKVKQWAKNLILFACFQVYLLLGAWIFRVVERGKMADVQSKVEKIATKFVIENYNCIGFEDLVFYGNVVSKAVDEGAIFGSAPPAFLQSEEDLGDGVWTIHNSFFLCLTIVTTIGYGTIAPKTTLGKILCVIYAMFGLYLTWLTLSAIGATISNVVTHKKVRAFYSKLCTKFKNSRTRFYLGLTFAIEVLLSLIGLLVLVPAILVSYSEGWSYTDAVYYLFITLTTIGLGDLTLYLNRNGEFIEVFYIICLTVYIFIGMSTFSAFFHVLYESEKREIKKTQVILKAYISQVNRIIPSRRTSRDVTPEMTNSENSNDEIPGLGLSSAELRKLQQRLSRIEETRDL